MSFHCGINLYVLDFLNGHRMSWMEFIEMPLAVGNLKSKHFI
jgi:hypothetical protein